MAASSVASISQRIWTLPASLPCLVFARQDITGATEKAAPNYAGTMKTGVPISTWSNSHSAYGMYIRMQPCDAE
jgi:hypothetical protein